jgi:hypothetical protein
MIVAGEDAAGEIARARNDRGPRGTQQRIGHLAHDAVEPVCDHRHHDRIEMRGGCLGFLGGLVGRFLRCFFRHRLHLKTSGCNARMG